jgi:hypothetical protein
VAPTAGAAQARFLSREASGIQWQVYSRTFTQGVCSPPQAHHSSFGIFPLPFFLVFISCPRQISHSFFCCVSSQELDSLSSHDLTVDKTRASLQITPVNTIFQSLSRSKRVSKQHPTSTVVQTSTCSPKSLPSRRSPPVHLHTLS